MKTQEELLTTQVIEFLNKNALYALLRNFEGLPEKNLSKDIDIIIDRRDFKKIKKSIIELFLSFDYKIVTYYKSERMYTFILSDKEFSFLQFDFFFNTSLHGIIFLKSKDVLEKRLFNGKVFHVSKEFEFLDKYLYLKAVNQSYPSKYSDTLHSVLKNPKVLDETIQSVVGLKNFHELDNLSSQELRYKFVIKNLRSNFISIVRNLFFEFSNIFRSQGISMSFTGPDGVGKTTVIDKLIERVSGNHAEVKLFHHRPTVIGNIGAVAKNIGVTESINDNYTDPHRGKKNNLFSSFLRLSYYSFDYIIGYWLRIKRTLYRRGFIIFDRYYSDIIADSRRSSIYINSKILYAWGKLFIPKIDYNFLVTAGSDIILSRKQELDKKGIEDINEKLHFLAQHKGYYLIKNEGTADEALQKILMVVVENQHRKNLKRAC
ncbi:hypothetical protein [Salinimicrobium sp. TH3]|uniref:hypothetical protein n=1 Tax=Salinimicrobium sp. TH3 TaxID=2997342 RepID=UPI0022763484|nr:hypothetical protein [Salinimicrobium sp. TH3]MCY2687796.1 hypothetical protein [Salinimicrobium sp. TH3]